MVGHFPWYKSSKVIGSYLSWQALSHQQTGRSKGANKENSWLHAKRHQLRDKCTSDILNILLSIMVIEELLWVIWAHHSISFQHHLHLHGTIMKWNESLQLRFEIFHFDISISGSVLANAFPLALLGRIELHFFAVIISLILNQSACGRGFSPLYFVARNVFQSIFRGKMQFIRVFFVFDLKLMRSEELYGVRLASEAYRSEHESKRSLDIAETAFLQHKIASCTSAHNSNSIYSPKNAIHVKIHDQNFSRTRSGVHRTRFLWTLVCERDTCVQKDHICGLAL
jgi:hypothetical protein